jgi:hypothetical protein
MSQVHKEQLSAVDNALPNRSSLDIEIFGMEGVPEDIIQSHNQRVITQFQQAEMERRAATGNPPPGASKDGSQAKKPKLELSDLKKRIAEHKAKLADQAAGGSSGEATPVGAGQTTQVVSCYPWLNPCYFNTIRLISDRSYSQLNNLTMFPGLPLNNHHIPNLTAARIPRIPKPQALDSKVCHQMVNINLLLHSMRLLHNIRSRRLVSPQFRTATCHHIYPLLPTNSPIEHTPHRKVCHHIHNAPGVCRLLLGSHNVPHLVHHRQIPSKCSRYITASHRQTYLA